MSRIDRLHGLQRVESGSESNWSEVARSAFEAKIEEVESTYGLDGE